MNELKGLYRPKVLDPMCSNHHTPVQDKSRKTKQEIRNVMAFQSNFYAVQS